MMETTGGDTAEPADGVSGVPAPELYGVYSTDDIEQTEWIIKGTDGKLYLVPSEPGGWLQRTEYQGDKSGLNALSQEEARSICWTVYGDVGRVIMEGADLEPR